MFRSIGQAATSSKWTLMAAVAAPGRESARRHRNSPKRPYEASGTSGMKAALDGVPSLSVLDGWWIEGWIEGVTGWAISDHAEDLGEANSLYEQLEQAILPLFYLRLLALQMHLGHQGY
jgi:hypothetical protein